MKLFEAHKELEIPEIDYFKSVIENMKIYQKLYNDLMIKVETAFIKAKERGHYKNI